MAGECPLASSLAGDVFKFRVRAAFKERLDDLCETARGGDHQGGALLCVDGVRVCAFFEEQLHERRSSVIGRPNKRRDTVVVVRAQVSAVIEEQLRKL